MEYTIKKLASFAEVSTRTLRYYDEILKIISDPKFDGNTALIKHHQSLLEKREQLNQLILNVEKTIAYHKGEIHMSNSEKFNLSLSEEDMINMGKIEIEMINSLKAVLETDDLESKDAKNVYEKYKEW